MKNLYILCAIRKITKDTYFQGKKNRRSDGAQVAVVESDFPV